MSEPVSADVGGLGDAIQDGAIFRYVPKPFTPLQLQSAVEEYFHSTTAGVAPEPESPTRILINSKSRKRTKQGQDHRRLFPRKEAYLPSSMSGAN